MLYAIKCLVKITNCGFPLGSVYLITYDLTNVSESSIVKHISKNKEHAGFTDTVKRSKRKSFWHSMVISHSFSFVYVTECDEQSGRSAVLKKTTICFPFISLRSTALHELYK